MRRQGQRSRPRCARRPFVIPPPGAAAAAPAGWWLAGGVDPSACVAAYQAIGAASLADSYTNLADPETNDLTTSDAPTWGAAAGWTFGGLDTTHLNTGLQWANTWTVIVRCYCEGRGISGYGRAIGGAVDTLAIAPDTGDGLLIKNGTTNFTALAAATVDTVIAIAGGDAYRDGADIGDITVGSISEGAAYIGNRASLNREFRGTIQAAAFYNATLSAAQVAAVTAAMEDLA